MCIRPWGSIFWCPGWFSVSRAPRFHSTKHLEQPLYWITRSKPIALSDPHSTQTPGSAPISVDAALTIAKTIVPGAEPSAIFIPSFAPIPNIHVGGKLSAAPSKANRPGVYTIYLKFPEDRTPAGRCVVKLDQFTGVPLAVTNSRTSPAGARAFNLNRPIHTGDLYGLPSRFLASAASGASGHTIDQRHLALVESAKALTSECVARNTVV